MPKQDRTNARLPQATTSVLAEHAAVIRALGKRVVGDVIEIGRRLVECKRIAGHGGWLPWLDREFGWEETTALRFMRVHELQAKSGNLQDLNIPVSGLYLLAAPSVPEEVRTDVIERAEAGETFKHKDVQAIVAKAKPKPTEPKLPPIITADMVEQRQQAEFEAGAEPTATTKALSNAAKKERECAREIADRAEERLRQTQHAAEQVQKAAESVLVPEQPRLAADIEHVLPVADRLVLEIMERDRIAPGYAKAVMDGIAAKLATSEGIPQFLKRAPASPAVALLAELGGA